MVKELPDDLLDLQEIDIDPEMVDVCLSMRFKVRLSAADDLQCSQGN